jgi:fatty acid desaturase
MIITFQYAIFHFVGDDFERFLFASPVAILITSSIAMSYIFTNHFLNPLSARSDPLATTTSIVVYRLFDRLHLNFSYHTEHHIFPGMNSDYYPKVSHLLKDYYGNRYNRIGFGDAWNRLSEEPGLRALRCQIGCACSSTKRSGRNRANMDAVILT